MNRVQVLMSTYNGEKYLSEQIDSILRQVDVNLKLFIRDDGSTDNTMEILELFRVKYPERISYYKGLNIGTKASFVELIRNSEKDFEYFAFSDQDDVWLEDKLARGLSLIKRGKQASPSLYCSRTKLVDQQLKELTLWPPLPCRPLTINNALVENVAVGCTIVINKSARDLIKLLEPDTKEIIMHDWWMYICISAFGNVYCDKVPGILYRQHGNNQIGGNDTVFNKWKKTVSRFARNESPNSRQRQAHEFLKIVKDKVIQTKDINEIVGKLVDYRSVSLFQKSCYVLYPKLYRQSAIENFYLRLMIMLNRL